MISKPVLKYLERFKDLSNVWVCPIELFTKIEAEISVLARKDVFDELFAFFRDNTTTFVVDMNRVANTDFSVYQSKDNKISLEMFNGIRHAKAVFDIQSGRMDCKNIKEGDAATLLSDAAGVFARLVRMSKEAPEIVESHRVYNKNSRDAKRSIYSYINITNRKRYINSEPQGTHKSPIEHVRRAHVKHRKDKDGVIKEIQVRETIVNKGGEKARMIKVVK